MVNKQELQLGLNFAVQYDLSVRDMEVFVKLLESDYTTEEVAEAFNESKCNVYRVIQRLKSRNLIITKGKQPISFSYVYSVNPELVTESKVVDAEEFIVEDKDTFDDVGSIKLKDSESKS